MRSRAENLLRYGAHLSPGLLDLARSLLPKDHPAHQHAHHHSHHHAHGSNGNGNGAHGAPATAAKRSAREIFGITDDDDESPYRD